MHVIEWVTKTVNRDGKLLRHLKSQKINLFSSFLYFWALNLVFICPTFCHMKTTCLLLMKQKLYALDAFFIEKLKLSENDPCTNILDCPISITLDNVKHWIKAVLMFDGYVSIVTIIPPSIESDIPLFIINKSRQEGAKNATGLFVTSDNNAIDILVLKNVNVASHAFLWIHVIRDTCMPTKYIKKFCWLVDCGF